MAGSKHQEISVHDLLDMMQSVEQQFDGQVYFVMSRQSTGGKPYLWIDIMFGKGRVRFDGMRFSAINSRWPNWSSKTFTGCLYRLAWDLYSHLEGKVGGKA